ncbi:TraR/DksA C4-type zinc finger protein [Streptomyces sp. NPDC007162]|uniref:TraR/DksA family transcriptional regulator n=1 Tax=Streptomyces sp. NPDC007162 TaxID=3156917 RepID=UPI0033CCFF39
MNRPLEEATDVSPDTPRAETRRDRLTADEALERLAHERSSRLTQLQAIREAGPDAKEPVMSTQKDTVQRVLTEVEAAFARVQDGTYGFCRNCSRPIPVERLEILPHTPFCVPCQRGGA